MILPRFTSSLVVGKSLCFISHFFVSSIRLGFWSLSKAGPKFCKQDICFYSRFCSLSMFEVFGHQASKFHFWFVVVACCTVASEGIAAFPLRKRKFHLRNQFVWWKMHTSWCIGRSTLTRFHESSRSDVVNEFWGLSKNIQSASVVSRSNSSDKHTHVTCCYVLWELSKL